MNDVITVECDGYDCQNVAVVKAQNANNALQAMGWTIQSGSDCSSVELCPRCAELARREQAQAPQPENLHQYKSALANMEQTINELRRENARLRSLLAAANHYCDVYCNSMDSAAIEAAHDAMIEAAKEAV